MFFSPVLLLATHLKMRGLFVMNMLSLSKSIDMQSKKLGLKEPRSDMFT